MVDRDLVLKKLAFIVHGYETVDLAIVRDVVQNRLPDLLAFVAAVRARMQSA